MALYLDLKSPSSNPFWRGVLALWAFSRHRVDLGHYDWALFSGIYAPIAVRSRPHGRNVLYCHAIPRFCFDLRDYYMARTPFFARPLLIILIWFVSRNFAAALRHMDAVVANSENVAQRLLQHFGRSSIVIHPPVAAGRFRWQGDEGFYLSLGRLEPLKRVDLIIRAFLEMPDKQLVVASGGSELQRLKCLAGEAGNISFTGWQSLSELSDCLGRARAAIYVPINEDFGLSPVEAMAAGKPVIGVAEGGLLETIVHGETGYLINGALTVEKLRDAVRQIEIWEPSGMRSACQLRAQAFSEERFLARIKAMLEPDCCGE